MKTEFYMDSCGKGKIRCCQWSPEGAPKAIIQIVHGIAEHIDRYEDFASFLNRNGILVVAEDHMGHGKSIGVEGIQGYFHGGWFSAVEDTYALLKKTMGEFPGVPYILFGHSMGSFMARTILIRHPDSGIYAAIISGTAWQEDRLLSVAKPLSRFVCGKNKEQKPSKFLQKLMFGSYNGKIKKPRTAYDWLTRDESIVDAYITDPLCGFVASAGLARDMLEGIDFIQQPENMAKMDPKLPVLFISGREDPVGGYGEGVKLAASKFSDSGMVNVSAKFYSECRHELLNELNKEEVYNGILNWIRIQLG